MSMPTLPLLRVIGALALVLTIAGCGFTSLGEGVPGGRRWVIPVVNGSAQPARLFVAEDDGLMGPLVGRATPDRVPAGAAVDVVFDVPPGEGWAIFVNPGPNNGPLILARDVPSTAAGRLPVKIDIDATGQPGYSAPEPGDPGWFDN